MRCKPCGAPRNPNAERCDYCQSWHEGGPRQSGGGFLGRVSLAVHNPEQAQFQTQMRAQMMAQDASYQLQRSHMAGMANAYAGLGGLFGRVG